MIPRLQDRNQRSRDTPGVVVTAADGQRYWFPGSTPELGMILAKSVFSTEQLDHPYTHIEFGLRKIDGNQFHSTKLIKKGTREDE